MAEAGPLLLLDQSNDQSDGTDAPLTDVLAAAGWKVIAAESIDQAFALAKSQRPQVVVVHRTPQPGDPLALLKKMRASAHTALTPVVAVIPSGDAQRQALKIWGVETFVDPPAAPESMIQAIQRHAPVPMTLVAPAQILEEPARMKALARTGLLDSPPDALFDRVAQLAARLLDVPVVLLSLVDANRQFFKTQVGVPEPVATARQTPLTHSFCQWVVSSDDELVVPDVQRHRLLGQNRATVELGVGAYAGVPLRSDGVEPIGSFCVIDMKPHAWDERELRALRDAARVVDGLCALRQTAHAPPLTIEDWQALSGVVGHAMQSAAKLHLAGRPKMDADEEHRWLSLTADLGRQLSECARR
ncbi:MAG TPA: GAF domain-containing protein [Vicinamibacterales bacterium]|nr:GAF domain-containing protein [Vicinamibacterales bacterium]